jgi:hypothetical protein
MSCSEKHFTKKYDPSVLKWRKLHEIWEGEDGQKQNVNSYNVSWECNNSKNVDFSNFISLYQKLGLLIQQYFNKCMNMKTSFCRNRTYQYIEEEVFGTIQYLKNRMSQIYTCNMFIKEYIKFRIVYSSPFIGIYFDLWKLGYCYLLIVKKYCMYFFTILLPIEL